MISKELLSKVLELDVKELEFNFKYNCIRYGYWNSCVNNRNEDISGVDYLKINIYELAHKCKEWAVNLSPNKHALSSYPRWSDIRNYKKTNGSYYICQHLVSGVQFEAESEPEAIFKACQWILDKDSK